MMVYNIGNLLSWAMRVLLHIGSLNTDTIMDTPQAHPAAGKCHAACPNGDAPPAVDTYTVPFQHAAHHLAHDLR